MARLLTFVCILGVYASTAVAGINEFESCRCSNGLVSKGDSKQEVLQECGQPTRIQKSNTKNKECRELWIYNFGKQEFMQGICFDSSETVKKVISLGSGY